MLLLLLTLRKIDFLLGALAQTCNPSYASGGD
jgi:hypothetical protein